MEKTNLGVLILMGITIVGIIVLTAMGKATEVLVPIVTALLGFMAGNNKEMIVGLFKRGK